MPVEIMLFELWPWLPLSAIATYGIYLFLIRRHSRLKYLVNLLYFYLVSFTIISASIISHDIYANWRLGHFDLDGDGIFTRNDQSSPIRDYYYSFVIHDTGSTFWFLASAFYATLAVILVQTTALVFFAIKKTPFRRKR